MQYANYEGKAATANGGAGGAGAVGYSGIGYTHICGQGAGNPGGENGTGGTLIMYAKNFNNVGTISSNGSKSGKGRDKDDSTGGGSGRRKY